MLKVTLGNENGSLTRNIDERDDLEWFDIMEEMRDIINQSNNYNF